MPIVLESSSIAYLASLGVTDTSSATEREAAFTAALDRLSDLLQNGSELKAGDASYILDYIDEESVAGAGNSLRVRAAIIGNPGPGPYAEWKSTPDAGEHRIFNDDVVALMSNGRLWADAEIRDFMQNGINNAIYQGEEPPASAVRILGERDPAATNTQMRNFFDKIVARQGGISDALVDAFLSYNYSDAERLAAAKMIVASIRSNMALDGSVNSTLMGVLKTLCPNGYESDGSLSPAYWHAINAEFEGAAPMPSFGGWAWTEMQSQLRLLDSGVARVDTARLAELERVQPWAAAYVRFEYLRRQAINGTNLDLTQLNKLAQFNSAAAVIATEIQLRDGLQTTNQLYSASGGLNGTSPTTDTTPHFRIDLSGMGTTMPVAGDTLLLYARRQGDGAKSTATLTLTQADIDRGYADLGWDTALSDGKYTVTSMFTAGGSRTYTSPESLPFNLTIDTTGPVIKKIEAVDDGREFIVTFEDDAGLGSVGGLWSFPDLGRSLVPPALYVDQQNKRARVVFGQAIDLDIVKTVGIYGIGGAPAGSDLLGNSVASYTSMSITEVSTLPTVVASVATLSRTAPRPRPLDTGALSVLKALSPAKANYWESRYQAAGLPRSANTGDVGETDAEGNPAPSLQVALILAIGKWRAALEQRANVQFEAIKINTEALTKHTKLQQLLTALRTAASNLSDTASISTAPGYAELKTQCNALAAELGIKGASGADYISATDTKITVSSKVDEVSAKATTFSGGGAALNTEMQMTMGKIDESTELQSNSVSLLHRTTMNIVGNIGR